MQDFISIIQLPLYVTTNLVLFCGFPIPETSIDDDNAREEEPQKGKTPDEIKTAEVYAIVEKEFGPVRNGMETYFISDMISHYPQDWIIEAIRKPDTRHNRKSGKVYQFKKCGKVEIV